MSKRSCAAAGSVADAFLRMARVNCFTTNRHAYHKNRAAAGSVADAFLRMARVNCFTTDRHAYHKKPRSSTKRPRNGGLII